jgi:hypothetical protein
MAALLVIGAAVLHWWPAAQKPLPSLGFPLEFQSMPRSTGEAATGQPGDADKPGAIGVLPRLEKSDGALQDAMAGLFGPRWPGRLFHRHEFVRRFVVTVDNLPRAKLPSQALLIKPPTGYFLATQSNGRAEIDPRNARRYTIYAQFAELVDPKALVGAYVFFYPLLLQEYRLLGYPTGSFNDRVIEAIDDLLMTPDGNGPVALVQRRVLYEFADPELEALSAGEKIMLRMGAGNAAKVKAKLREIRDELESVSDSLGEL